MNRKRLSTYVLVALVGIIFSLLSVPLIEAKTYVMRFAAAPPKGDIRYQATYYMQKELPRATNGSVTVELFQGTLGGEREILERLALGTLEAYMGSTGPLEALTREPIASIYDVPYLFKDWDHLYTVTRSKVGQQYNQTLTKKGIRILDYVSMGNRAVYFRKTPIRKPEDLKGLKIRVMENPVYIAMYKEFGALPVPMAWPEIYTALQTGVLDGVDGSLSSGLASKHTESVKYVNFLGNHVVIASILAVSEQWWQSLPENLREIILTVAHEAAIYEHGRNDEYLEQLKRQWVQAGVQFVDIDREAMVAVARKVYPMVEKKMGSDLIKEVIKIGQ
jgi:tripartite ATP-independent transporter DctP family solute receptor